MNNFIQRIFNRTHEELKLSDVENFFKTPQEETTVLEFKSGDVDIIKVFKEVAAFHNTEGGLLIIGAPRETKTKINGKNTEVKRCEGDLTYSAFQSKDWILQKLGSNIVPFPVGIKIKEFHKEAGSIYLIDVPQSTNPPHQCAADGCYYIRIDNEAKPAPHGFVQAMFNHRKSPILVADITCSGTKAHLKEIHVSISNESMIPAEGAEYLIEVFNPINFRSDDIYVQQDSSTEYTKLVCSKSAGSILVKKIKVTSSFSIEMPYSYIYVCVGIWSKISNINFYHFILDFKEDSVHSEIDNGDQYEELSSKYVNLVNKLRSQERFPNIRL